MKKRTVGIVGGGPAGMMAAITAARHGAEVTLFERNDRIGKKLLATGNGKCNLGNLDLSEKEYYGSSPEWISACLSQFGAEDTIQFFRGLGLLIKHKNGYLYPASEQAAVVLDVLRIELKELGVHIVTNCKINRIAESRAGCGSREGDSDSKRQIELWSGDICYCFERVILACGSKAAPKTGSDGSGYKLAAQLKHTIIPTVPALVQLRCREDYLKAVSGVRAEAEIVIAGLYTGAAAGGPKNPAECFSQRGELQLTDYGISGIPVFQLSRVINYLLREEKEIVVQINLLPDFSEEEYLFLQESRMLLQQDRTVEEFFTGMLNKKLMMLFIKMAGLKPGQLVGEADREDVKQVFALCRNWRLHVTGSNPYDNAQVCAGGVDTLEIRQDMESAKMPGVFFAGEIMDVDGKCGGYNLQWAWCSGYLAGMGATNKEKKHDSNSADKNKNGT